MNKWLKLFLFNLAFLTACADEPTICKEIEFVGPWHVESITTVENLKTHATTESVEEFDITFLEDQSGYFDNDTSAVFIWGTHCQPAALLISVGIQQPDTSTIDYYSTELFLAQPYFVGSELE